MAGLLQLLSRNLKQNVTLTDFYNIYDDVRVLKLVAFAFVAHCNFWGYYMPAVCYPESAPAFGADL